MQRALLWLLPIVAILLGLGLYMRPRPGPQRIAVTPSITGVRDGFSYSWIVKTAHGAVLIDTTADPKGRALLAELDAEKIDPSEVHAILLTHGHFDHWVAASLFPAAKIYLGAGDRALVTGAASSRAPGRALVNLVKPKGIVVPETLNELAGDSALVLDGLRVQAIAVPGHTQGSMMYRVNDVLFAGDALRAAGDGVAAAPWLMSDDAPQARRSLDKLRLVDFRRAADGHSGLIEDAKSKLLAFLAAHER